MHRQKTIGLKELHRNLAKIMREAHRGTSFVIFKNTTPFCNITPITEQKKKYTLADFKKIRFHGDKNLSTDVDKILYGV